MDVAVQGLIIPCSVRLGNRHRGTDGDADEESHDEAGKGAGRTDGGQSAVRGVVADNQEVDGAVELLQEVREQQREGEEKQLLPDDTRRCVNVADTFDIDLCCQILMPPKCFYRFAALPVWS